MFGKNQFHEQGKIALHTARNHRLPDRPNERVGRTGRNQWSISEHDGEMALEPNLFRIDEGVIIHIPHHFVADLQINK
jgi:hypothetical protein